MINKTQILKKVDAEYRPTVKNLDVGNPRLLVLFSGAPGTGKSTIAKAVEEQLRGVRLENDAVRTLIHQQHPDFKPNHLSQLTYTYMHSLLLNLLEQSKNGLVIIDASIDRRYDDFTALAQANHFTSFMIALDIPLEQHNERIRKQGGHPFVSQDTIFSLLPKRRAEQAVFLKNHTPDFTVTPTTPVSAAVKAVRQRLQSLAS